jgi:hypothetical protein
MIRVTKLTIPEAYIIEHLAEQNRKKYNGEGLYLPLVPLIDSEVHDECDKIGEKQEEQVVIIEL